MYRKLFNKFLCAKYFGVKPRTGKMRLGEIHTKLFAVQIKSCNLRRARILSRLEAIRIELGYLALAVQLQSKLRDIQ
jgi:hypothetical protein